MERSCIGGTLASPRLAHYNALPCTCTTTFTITTCSHTSCIIETSKARRWDLQCCSNCQVGVKVDGLCSDRVQLDKVVPTENC